MTTTYNCPDCLKPITPTGCGCANSVHKPKSGEPGPAMCSKCSTPITAIGCSEGCVTAPSKPDKKTAKPIAARLCCEKCGELHIDEGRWATHPHHTHSCQYCGLTWRPMIECSVGVRFLPGFKSSLTNR
jgi:hypothetical protein